MVRFDHGTRQRGRNLPHRGGRKRKNIRFVDGRGGKLCRAHITKHKHTNRVRTCLKDSGGTTLAPDLTSDMKGAIEHSRSFDL